ncbi:MAG: hypothetical protein ABIQ95_12685 [Bdellovibrionia bacterium]
MSKLKSPTNSKYNISYSIARPLLGLIAVVFFVLMSFGFSSKRSEKAPPPDSTNGGTSPSPTDSSVWIMRSDGAKYCETGSGSTLAQGSADLEAAQIAVLASKKGSDGKMHAQVCGGSRGSTNNYLINRDKLSQALALGYSEVISSR